MLIRFSVENFRSVWQEQELSLVAAESLSDNPEALIPAPAIKGQLLRAAAFYGANASGKSNFLKALEFMKAAVRRSQTSWGPDTGTPYEPFLMDEEAAKGAGSFEVDLLLEGVRYQYGFSLDGAEIKREWLVAFPTGRPQTWFQRDISDAEPFKFGKNLTGPNRTIQNVTRKNSLFLSAAAQLNHEQLRPVYTWFSRGLEVISDTNRDLLMRQAAEACRGNADLSRSMIRLLGAADLGIVDLEAREMEVPQQLKDALDAFGKALGLDEPPSSTSPSFVTLKHEVAGRIVGLPLSDESTGTQALFAILRPVLSSLAEGRLLCIDELNWNLHPLLALQLVRLFNNRDSNPAGAQLIFNTHDTNLLDSRVLRRDQIWFVERDENRATRVYPLTDFRPRKEENLERGYLQGRYGAVPYVGSLDVLEEEQKDHA